MNKEKIIDLLNLVYEKKAPKKILYKYCEYEFNSEIEDYQNRDGLELFSYLFSNKEQVLYIEVEIIEEDKEIEELSNKVHYCYSAFQNGMTKSDRQALDNDFKEIRNTIDKIINKLKKEGK